MTIIPMPSPVAERIKKRVLAAVAHEWPNANGRRLVAVGRSEAGQPFQVVSDPAFVRWQAEGAPKCNATWSDINVLPNEQREGYVGM